MGGGIWEILPKNIKIWFLITLLGNNYYFITSKRLGKLNGIIEIFRNGFWNESNKYLKLLNSTVIWNGSYQQWEVIFYFRNSTEFYCQNIGVSILITFFVFYICNTVSTSFLRSNISCINRCDNFSYFLVSLSEIILPKIPLCIRPLK